MKIDKTVAVQTRYVAVVTLVLSVLMQVVFAVLKYWDYTVLLGNVLGAVTAAGNFLLMGLTVQKVVNDGGTDAAKRMQLSQSGRLLMQGAVLVAAALLPWFNLWAAALPLLFPRFAILLWPLFKGVCHLDDE